MKHIKWLIFGLMIFTTLNVLGCSDDPTEPDPTFEHETQLLITGSVHHPFGPTDTAFEARSVRHPAAQQMLTIQLTAIQAANDAEVRALTTLEIPLPADMDELAPLNLSFTDMAAAGVSVNCSFSESRTDHSQKTVYQFSGESLEFEILSVEGDSFLARFQMRGYQERAREYCDGEWRDIPPNNDGKVNISGYVNAATGPK